MKVVESLGRETLLYADAGPLADDRFGIAGGLHRGPPRPSVRRPSYGAPIRLSVDPRDVFVFDPAGPTIRYAERQFAID